MRLLLGTGGIVFVIAYIFVKYLSMAPEPDELGPRHHTTFAGREGNISITTFVGGRELEVPTSRTAEGKKAIPVEVAIENHSLQTVVQPHWLSFDLGGLERARPECWGKLGAPDLATGPICAGAAPGWDAEALRLRPGGVVTFHADVSACQGCSGRFELDGVLGWALEPLPGAPGKRGNRAGAQPENWRTRLAFGGVRVGQGDGKPRRISAAIVDGVKDLALPATLALLGWWFQSIQQKRSESAAKAQQDQAERSEIFRAQLPKMHEYLSEHYLPMRFNLRRLRVLLDNAPLGGAKADLDGVAFRLLLFLRQRKHLRDKRGGLFFGSAAGEQLASAAISTLALKLPGALGDGGFAAGERLMAVLRVDDENALFQSRLQSSGEAPQPQAGDVTQLSESGEAKPAAGSEAKQPREAQRADWKTWRDAVATWAAGNPGGQSITVGSAAQIAAFLAEVLWIESNRPFYEVWYRDNLFKQERIEMLTELWGSVSEPLEAYRREYDPNATSLAEAFSHYLPAASVSSGGEHR